MDHGDHGDHGGEGDHGGDDNMNMDHSMSMSFHFGVVETILFDFWKTSDVGSLIGSVVLVFLLGVAYEGIKFVRDFVQMRHGKKACCATYNSQSEDGSTPNLIQRNTTPPRIGIFSSMHIGQTFLHFVQFVLSYFLMLIFMTYNVWLCLGVALGATTGYFFFGWQKQCGSVHDPNEHCH